MGSSRRQISPAPARRAPAATLRTLAAIALCGALAVPVAQSGAQSIDELNSQIAGARAEAQDLGAEIEAASAELASVQAEAIAAAQREAQLSAVLARGEAREASLEAAVGVAERELRAARARLAHSLDLLADR